MSSTKVAGGGINEGNEKKVDRFSSGIIHHVKELYGELLTEHQEHKRVFTEVQKSADSEHAEFLDTKGQGAEAFLAYLASPQSSILGPEQDEDLNHPLSQYFVSSSHNTYLTGNQLSSEASTEGYKNVLLRGCRCVEIDVWDGKSPEEQNGSDGEKLAKENRGLRGRLHDKIKSVKSKTASKESAEKNENTTSKKDGDPSPQELPSATKRAEPRVLHGYTLTKEVPFRDVCEAIRDTAFVSSDLPIIVSLEIHTSVEQQEIMVEIINQTWKDYLVPPLDDKGKEPTALPTPNDLRNKILVKVKYTPPEQEVEKEEAEAKGLQKTPSSSSSEGDLPKGNLSKDEKPRAEKPKKKKMLEALSELGVYTRSHHFKSWHQPEAKEPTHVFSLSEGAVTEAMENQGAQLFKHNQDFMMRTYPKGTRISSSNLTPTIFWRQGIQMVALNWQKWDKGSMLNEAMFADTGGWVLKPPNYRSADPSIAKRVESNSSSSLHPSTAQTQDNTHANRRRSHAHTNKKILDLSIEFLAAQNLPLPLGDVSESSFKPYIKVSLHAETPTTAKTQPSTLRRSLSRRHSHGRARSRSNSKAGASASTAPQSPGQEPNAAAGESSDAAAPTPLQQRTSTSRSTNADFSRQTLAFTAVPIDEESLCFVRFKVEDDVQFQRDPMAAWACVRLDRVREGVRTVRLFDAEGKVSDGLLVVKVTKTFRDANGGEGAGLPLR